MSQITTRILGATCACLLVACQPTQPPEQTATQPATETAAEIAVPSATSVTPASAPSAAEAGFLKSTALDRYAKVEYRDAADQPLSFAGFMQAVQGGKSFAMEKQRDHSSAVVRIDGDLDDADAFAPKMTVKVGDVLPPLGKLQRLDGHTVGDADLQGHYTLLSFYFAECAPCIAEVPALNGYAKAHPDIAAYALTFDDTATAQAFVRERGLQWPVLAGARAFIDSLGVKSYPTLLLIDGKRRVAAVHRGGGIGKDQMTTTTLDAWAKAAMR